MICFCALFRKGTETKQNKKFRATGTNGDLRKPKLYGNHFHIQHLLLRKRKQSQMRDMTGRGVFLSALECYILSD